ncbi:hypothetical protein CF65_00122 [Aggregatibacter actinomycetemcomitans HK1651]|nr:hypothetical protein CF65_00122 [Aggregatibacter actinomycetemcomitans HK1651]
MRLKNTMDFNRTFSYVKRFIPAVAAPFVLF